MKVLNKGYNFSLDLTSIEGFHKKLWASKIVEVSIWRISGLPTWESQDKMTFGCRPYGQEKIILYGGRWWLPSSSGFFESCEFVFACGSFVHQKCSNYALTNLLFGLYKFVWIIDSLITLPSPHPRALACPSTPEMLRARECTLILYPSIVSTCGFVVESIKELGGVSKRLHPNRFFVNFKEIWKQIKLKWTIKL
jgi:hypothetical protein